MMTLPVASDQSCGFEAQVEELRCYVQAAVNGDEGLHTVEGGIWRHILAIGRSALRMCLSLVGDGDAGESLGAARARR